MVYWYLWDKLGAIRAIQTRQITVHNGACSSPYLKYLSSYEANSFTQYFPMFFESTYS